MSQHPQFYHDPDGSKWRAREKRISELMRQGEGDRFHSERCYYELVYDNEEAPFTTDREQLTAAGFSLPRAESLADPQLTVKLAELIEELARMHAYLNFTDHLSDRELYSALVDEVLNCERRDIPMAEGAAWHLDLSQFGSGMDPDADVSDLEEVADRDRHLPGAPC